MKRIGLAVALLVFTSAFLFTLTILPDVKATTLYVGGAGPGNYTTIQSAIDDANPGDSVYVYSGTYYESITIFKTLSLIGEDRDTTVINGTATGDVVHVTADGVNITGFTIANSGPDGYDSGIELYYVQNCNVAGSNFSNNEFGIYLYHSSSNRIVSNNASVNKYGITLRYSVNNLIKYNTVSTNAQSGIQLWYSDNNTLSNNTALSNEVNGIDLGDSNNNTVANNSISDNWDGILIIDGSNQNTVANNIAFSNSWSGIYLAFSGNNTVAGNNLFANDVGIQIQDSDSNTIVSNKVSSNNWYGVYFDYSDNNIATNNTVSNNGDGMYLEAANNNRIYHNNIINNTNQAFDDANTNQWDDGYPSGGNYWSDYTGIDNCSGPNQDVCPDPDGIGDTPYPIDADSRDRYPLTSPYKTTFPRPPRILEASLSGRNLENISITWSLSLDDGTGLGSVVGYEIYRNMTYDLNGLGYQLIASLPNGTSAFVDNYTGEGDPNNYFYRVCAVGLNNNTTYARNQAGKFTRLLATGPNLVSIPLIQSDESIETVLQTVSYDKAWAYHSNSTDPWKWHMPFKPYKGDLRSANHTTGIWINATRDCNLTVAGVVPARTTIHLYRGWNLVSFPSFKTAYTVADLKAEIGATGVEGYDLAPPYYLRVLGDAEALQAGYGYWVMVGADTTWTVNIQ